MKAVDEISIKLASLSSGVDEFDKLSECFTTDNPQPWAEVRSILENYDSIAGVARARFAELRKEMAKLS